jgi:hypothetical protein
LFGFCITHILNTGCAKIGKKFRRQKVKSETLPLKVGAALPAEIVGTAVL